MPQPGQTAPKRQVQSYLVSRGARGRLPRFAQTRVSVPCWPVLASAMGLGPMAACMANSWNQISSGFPRAAAGIAGAILRCWRRGMRPDPDLTVSEWADQHRKLASRASAEPGQYRTARTP